MSPTHQQAVEKAAFYLEENWGHLGSASLTDEEWQAEAREVLTAAGYFELVEALEEVAGDYDCMYQEPTDPSQPPSERDACRDERPDDRSYWCSVCVARSVLTSTRKGEAA